MSASPDGAPGSTASEECEEGFGLPTAATLIVSAFLVLMSGVFSGLTLGLLSLDKSSLEILAEAGDDKEKRQAKQIMPLRRDGNLLLCTLLIGNVIVNSLLSILLADLSSGLVGLFVSSALIVVLGEIIPQATCSRHGLAIGAKARFLVWAFIIGLYIVAKPIAWCLDKALGAEVGGFYSRDELIHLLNMQVKDKKDDGDASGIFEDERTLLVGALNYGNRTVADVMTKADDVFMLDISRKLTFETMLEIYKSGYTRIPVYENSRESIKGILYVKDLILIDPDDEITLEAIITFRSRPANTAVTESNFFVVSDLTPLSEVLAIFKSSFSHLMIAASFQDQATGAVLTPGQMAAWVDKDSGSSIARPKPFTSQMTGVITLEDVIEEVIDHEIVDEHDRYKSNETKAINERSHRRDITRFLSLFEHKVRESAKLSRHEVNAITAYLTSRVRQFLVFEGATSQLRQLVATSTVFDANEALNENSSEESDVLSEESVELLYKIDSPEVQPGHKVGRETVLYKRGCGDALFSLVLQGHVNVWAGEDQFHTNVGPWSTIGERALTDGEYRPDFTAITDGPCRLLQMRRAQYDAAASAVQSARTGPAQRAVQRRMRRTASGAQRATTATAAPTDTSATDNPVFTRSPPRHTPSADGATALPAADVEAKPSPRQHSADGGVAAATPWRGPGAIDRISSQSVSLHDDFVSAAHFLPSDASGSAQHNGMAARPSGELISTQHEQTGALESAHEAAWHAARPSRSSMVTLGDNSEGSLGSSLHRAASRPRNESANGAAAPVLQPLPEGEPVATAPADRTASGGRSASGMTPLTAPTLSDKDGQMITTAASSPSHEIAVDLLGRGNSDSNGAAAGATAARSSVLGQVVLMGGDRKPKLLEEGEVREMASSTELPTDLDASGRSKRRERGGMALAMVRGGTAKTPIFRPLTTSEALSTSTAGVAPYTQAAAAIVEDRDAVRAPGARDRSRERSGTERETTSSAGGAATVPRAPIV